jgi:hypothetical protein
VARGGFRPGIRFDKFTGSKMTRPPIADREATRLRFMTNMSRIAAITTFLHSGVAGLEQTGLFRSEGVRADLLRAVVVFLHASFEDFVRSHFRKPNKKVSFSSNSDIERALKRLKVEPALYKDLFPPLTPMTKRRHQIVHRADLCDAQSDTSNPWNITDDWQLIHWHLVVAVFYHRVRKATGPISMVEDRARQNVECALVKNIEFARELVAFPKLSLEERQQGAANLAELSNNILGTLKLNVEMFLDADGKPIEGALIPDVQT